jgi:hypothetical protein
MLHQLTRRLPYPTSDNLLGAMKHRLHLCGLASSILVTRRHKARGPRLPPLRYAPLLTPLTLPVLPISIRSIQLPTSVTGLLALHLHHL